MGETQFCRCNVKGSGKIFTDKDKYIEFEIIDLCAEDSKVFSPNEVDTGIRVRIAIVLPAILFQVEINTEAIIVQKTKTGNGFEYCLEFVDLSEEDKCEIDELMRSTCNMEY